MQQFLVLFREPDGRKDAHTAAEITEHRKNWNAWSEQMNKEHRIAGGMPLTLSGRVLHGTQSGGPGVHHQGAPVVTEGPHSSVTEGPHKVGDENVRRTGSPENVTHSSEKSNVCRPSSELLRHESFARIFRRFQHCWTLPRIPRSEPSVLDKEPPVLSDVGGYLLINAHSLDEATSLMQSCPIFEFGGYAEIREIMTPPGGSSPEARPASSDIAAPAASLQEQNKAIVRRFNTAFIQDGDIAAFHEIIDPSVINHTAPAGFSKGADGMLDVIEIFRKALTGLEVKILRQVAEDDIVVTYKTFHATHTGPLMGIPPSGQPVVITIIDIVRLRNGKYVEHWGIRDIISGTRVLPKM
jgi:predicted ester cyclase